MVYKIFISYSSKYNGKIAGDIKRYFEEYKGIECFVAHDDIQPGSKWENEIIENLNSSDYFMPIQTEYLKESFWCQQEAGFAFAKDIKIIPLIPDTDGTEPIGFYAKFQGFKIKVNDLKNSVKLLLIKEKIIQQGNMTEIDKRIYLFSKSNTYDEAGKMARNVLELEDELKESDILGILDITLKNDQIRNSYEARSALKDFFKKHLDIIPEDKLKKFFNDD